MNSREVDPVDRMAAVRVVGDRGMAALVVDRDLIVREVCSYPFARGLDPVSPGDHLAEVVPELTGLESMLQEVLEGRSPRYVLRLVGRDGPTREKLFVDMAHLPIHDEEGRISGLLHVVEDVTEMGRRVQWGEQQANDARQAKRLLELERRRLLRAQELNEVYVSCAAHELRSPMASILAYLELMAEGDYGDLSDGQRAAIDVLFNSARRLIDTTDQLLDVARLEEDKVELLLQPNFLDELIRRSLEEHAARAAERKIALRADLPAGPVTVLCDEVRVAQILANLVGNAIKYTQPGGGIQISIGSGAPSGYVRVEIEDDGVGISAEDREQLFTRFFRAESARVTGARGTGLGLHITRALVELHGGEIGVDSELGAGSTFWFTLQSMSIEE